MISNTQNRYLEKRQRGIFFIQTKGKMELDEIF